MLPLKVTVSFAFAVISAGVQSMVTVPIPPATATLDALNYSSLTPVAVDGIDEEQLRVLNNTNVRLQATWTAN